MVLTFHFGAAGHPVSWILHGVYGTAYGVALAAARTWHARMLEERQIKTPPGGQFVIAVNGDSVVRSDLLFEADYFCRHQEPDDCSWLCQFQGFPLAIPEQAKQVVTDELRRRLIDIGFLIPRAEWEARYPQQADLSRQFRALMQRDCTSPSNDRSNLT